MNKFQSWLGISLLGLAFFAALSTPIIIIGINYSKDITYFNILLGLDDPVHIFNRTINNHSMTFSNNCHGYDCYVGSVQYLYDGSFIYQNKSYHVDFMIDYVVTNYYIETYGSPSDTMNALETFLDETYPIGLVDIAYINVCEISSVRETCSMSDQQLPGLVQTWLDPPVQQVNDQITYSKNFLIVYGIIYSVALIIFILVVVIKSKVYLNIIYQYKVKLIEVVSII
jgi:hypothetical protein